MTWQMMSRTNATALKFVSAVIGIVRKYKTSVTLATQLVFAIQCDETADVAQCSQLMIYTHFVQMK